ncbi:hypothetical protein [Streptomyces sp. NPDC059479]|uniref:hypothetical protein n=1 Tax=Streptomyces sp. NPDC059479 TaxID=3346848 RepID=UPI00367C5638
MGTTNRWLKNAEHESPLPHAALRGNAMHDDPFTLALTVWVPSGAARAWLPCEFLRPLLGEEPIRTCEETRAVMAAQGRLVARLLSVPVAPAYPGFRILGRRKDTGLLVASAEWARGKETRQLALAGGGVWLACDWLHKQDRPLVA